MTYHYYKISSMYDVEVVSSKAEVLSVKDINRFFSVFLENQFPISFIKICKNLSICSDNFSKSNYITFNVQKTKIKGNINQFL